MGLRTRESGMVTAKLMVNILSWVHVLLSTQLPIAFGLIAILYAGFVIRVEHILLTYQHE